MGNVAKIVLLNHQNTKIPNNYRNDSEKLRKKKEINLTIVHKKGL